MMSSPPTEFSILLTLPSLVESSRGFGRNLETREAALLRDTLPKESLTTPRSTADIYCPHASVIRARRSY
ncbi:hypothetical protein B0H12DRAFT_1152263 [Mycena haematopus]|nr:hypothetical protein B0H12DRAFT_1152263 [Mycena haematopus]